MELVLVNQLLGGGIDVPPWFLYTYVYPVYVTT